MFEHALADLGARSTGLWLVQAGMIRFVGGVGIVADLPRSLTAIPVESDLPVGIAVRTGSIVTYGSVEERDRRWPALAGVDLGAGPVAFLPLRGHDRMLGCLNIGYGERTDAPSLDVVFLERLAELCAAALDRALLHDAERERQAFLLDASAAVSNAATFAEALQRLASVAVPRLADLCLIDVKEETGRIRRMVAVHADPARAPMVAELVERYPPDALGPHPAAEAMEAGRSVWSRDMPDGFLRSTTRDEHHLELTRSLGFRSYMSVPLKSGRQVLGAMTLVSTASERRFDGSDLALAEDLADHVADVVASARGRDREHELVEVLQQLLLPRSLPETEGIEVAARYLTARAEAEAGGDFYDLMQLPRGGLGFVIGDVEGHDAVAAATMGQLRSATRALAGQHSDPGAVLDALRWSWDLLGLPRTATAVIGRIDPASGHVSMTSAGHPAPVLVDAGGVARLVGCPASPPLGAPVTGRSVDHYFGMGSGDTLFLYTDGLVEARGGAIDAELDALVASLQGAAGKPLDELCDAVVGPHVEEGDRPDDIALLALRRTAR